MARRAVQFILTFLILAAVCAPVRAVQGDEAVPPVPPEPQAPDTIYSDYEGPLDMRTGLPPAGTSAEEGMEGMLPMDEEGTYFYDTLTRRYAIPAAGIIFYSTVPPGIVLGKNAGVQLEVPLGVGHNLYGSGEEIPFEEKITVQQPGSYVLQLQGNGLNETASFRFTILDGRATQMREYRLPAGFRMEYTSYEGEEETVLYGDYAEMELEGSYSFRYSSPVSGDTYEISMSVDHTAPTLALPEVKDGEADGPVTVADLEPGAVIEVEYKGEKKYIRNPEAILDQPGTYNLTVTDEAGNSTQYTFLINIYFNPSAVAAIVLLAAAVIGTIVYSRWVRKHCRVG